MASVESAAPEQLDFVGSLLVADTRAFVESWREALSSAAAPSSAQLAELRERSKTLQLRARAAGVGGLAHHLGVCNEHAEAWQRERLEQCLADVLELAWQLSQEVERGRPDAEAASGAVSVPAPSEAASSKSEPHSDPAPVPRPPLLHSPWRGWKRVDTGEGARAAQRVEDPAQGAAAPAQGAVAPAQGAVAPAQGAVAPAQGAVAPAQGAVAPAQPSPPEAASLEAASLPPVRVEPVTIEAEIVEPESMEAQSIEAHSIEADAPERLEPVSIEAESIAADSREPTGEESAPPTVVAPPSFVSQPLTIPSPAGEHPAPAAAPPASAEPSSPAAQSSPPAQPSSPSASPASPPAAPPLLTVEEEARSSEPVPSSRSVFAEPVLESGWMDEAAAAEQADAHSAEPFPLQQRQPAARQRGSEAARQRPGPPRPAHSELAQRVAELSSSPLSSNPQPPALLSQSLLASEGAMALGEVLGIVPPGQSPPPPPARERSPSPPPLALQRTGLPSLGAASNADEELTDQDLEIRLERVRRAAPFPLGRNEVAIDLPPPSEARFARRPPRRRLWWVPPLALGVLGGLALLALLLRPWQKDGGEQPGASLALTRSDALLPVQRLTDDREARLALLALVEGGGKESSELADLIREEVALVAKALVEPCAPGSPSCRLAGQAREMLEQPPLPKAPPSPPAPPGSWLEGLRQPLIGVKDDPRVQRLVDYHTNDPVGRELFQGLLFRCGAYHSLFSDTLMQHGLPLDLIAVPMVESGCILDAESPVGARGLWQFMPATARAYHLRVQEGVLDERLNPVKATDAALEFLRDLRSKLGSWELALASYNMGPFGLLSRMNRAGPGTGFWELVDAQRLPQETANYVPKIEAFALILANLEHFRFDAAQQMLGTSSTPLPVPAGTRLGQVARAVGCSQSRIRELNPDVLANVVPGSAGEEFTLRVPSDGAPRAREALERLVARADDADECVPANFDWGKQRLTKAMLSRCKR